ALGSPAYESAPQDPPPCRRFPIGPMRVGTPFARAAAGGRVSEGIEGIVPYPGLCAHARARTSYKDESLRSLRTVESRGPQASRSTWPEAPVAGARTSRRMPRKQARRVVGC